MSQNRSIWPWIAGLIGVGALAAFAIAAHQGTVLPSAVSADCGAAANVADVSLSHGAQLIALPLPGAIALAFANLFWLGIRLRRYA